MTEFNYVLYHAFSDTVDGGSPAAIVANAGSLDALQMQTIATDIGAPASCFITAIEGRDIRVRFFSTQTEYPMCGHGTICLVSWLLDSAVLVWDSESANTATVHTPGGSAEVDIRPTAGGRPEIMLALSAADFESVEVDRQTLADLFGVAAWDFDSKLPIELTRSDFNHLIVPVNRLHTMRRLSPDFAAITAFSRAIGVDTIALISRETVLAESDLHCREFCPAVGTPEAAATGTTNRAIACYLLRHGLVEANADGMVKVIAEQGYEMNRPSRISTELRLKSNQVVAVKTGGVASRVRDGICRLG
ncbi:MAG: trans-2,3-dihydro-3-hydroxyanthranilate isomerase [Planctomycetota bacterium]|jgi:trans-2,3-dihydro-3-hydroxyanthranilate isomerase